MPSITLTKADLVDWTVTVNSQASPGGTLNISSSANVGELDIDGTAADSESSIVSGVGAGPVGLEWDVEATGLLDISVIPENSIINTVEITVNATVEANGTAESDVAATFAGAGSCSAVGFVNLDANLETNICEVDVDEIGFLDNASDSDSGPNSAAINQPNSQSDTLTYHDTTTLDIPKADFTPNVSFFTGAINAAGASASSTQPRLTINASADVTLSAELHIVDWEVIITYTVVPVELEVTQSGELSLSGGGLVLTNDIVQSGELFLDGGGNEFYITLPDISGIYFLDPSATHDTFYIRDGDQGTMDVKIPRPFGKTAYLGD